MDKCPHCGADVEPRADTGRPRIYCSDAHRQAAYRARLRVVIPSDLPPVGDAPSVSTDPRSDVLILQDGERPTVLRDAASTPSGGVVGWAI